MLTGAGYIGAALLRRLAEGAAQAGGEPIVVLENFFSTPRAAVLAALPPDVVVVEGDVAEPADVARAFDALGDDDDPLVFHLAAQPSASVAVREPALTERSNLVGARIVLQAALQRQACVVFGGSFRVYGDELTQPGGACIDEDTAYGRVGDLSHLSKVYVEQLARMLGVRFASVRLGVTYGLSPIMKTSPAFMTVPNLFCQRAARGEVLQVLEDRPMAFIHVDDAVDALICAAEQSRGDQWQVYNAAPEVVTIGELARLVERLMQERGHVVRIKGATQSEAGFTVSSRLRFEPRRDLSGGLRDVVDHFLKRR